MPVSLRPSVRAAFMRYTAPLEGAVPFFYQDVRSLITIAAGVLCDPIELALVLPMRWPDGRLATRTEIAADWWLVKNDRSLAHRGAAAAGRVALLRLLPDDVEAVTLEKFDVFAEKLVARFPDMPEWPAPAQLATMSLAWACGTSFRFPKLEAALRARDFVTASAECEINATSNPGVVPRSAAQKALYLAAATATDPDALTLPGEAPRPAAPAIDKGAVEALTERTLQRSSWDMLALDRAARDSSAD